MDTVGTLLQAGSNILSTGASLLLGPAWGGPSSFGISPLMLANAEGRQDIHRIATEEAQWCTDKLSTSALSPAERQDVLLRALYCEMLGVEVQVAHIDALKLAQTEARPEKCLGYLAMSLMLRPTDEISVLAINTLQKDLSRGAGPEVLMALNTVCTLLTDEMASIVLPLVRNHVTNTRSGIRKKAVAAMGCLYALPSQRGDRAVYLETAREALGDKEPPVVLAGTNLALDLVKRYPSDVCAMAPVALSALEKAATGHLGDPTHHQPIPTPWLQLKLLSLLTAILSHSHQGLSGLQDVLSLVLHRAARGSRPQFGLLLECIRAIVKSQPSEALMQLAESVVEKYSSSDTPTNRFFCLSALAELASLNPGATIPHARMVVESLDHPDRAIREKTLSLLVTMANSSNVEALVTRLLSDLQKADDSEAAKHLVGVIVGLAERYAPSMEWYFDTIIELLTLHGRSDDLGPAANNLMRLFGEGFESASEDQRMRQLAVSTALSKLQPCASPWLVRTLAWILGEYVLLTGAYPHPSAAALNLLADVYSSDLTDPITRDWLLLAATKIAANTNEPIPSDFIEHSTKSNVNGFSGHVLEEVQRKYEARRLLKLGDLTSKLLPLDASCVELEVDPDLSFLDSFVQSQPPLSTAAENRPQEGIRLSKGNPPLTDNHIRITFGPGVSSAPPPEPPLRGSLPSPVAEDFDLEFSSLHDAITPAIRSMSLGRSDMHQSSSDRVQGRSLWTRGGYNISEQPHDEPDGSKMYLKKETAASYGSLPGSANQNNSNQNNSATTITNGQLQSISLFGRSPKNMFSSPTQFRRKNS